MIIVCSNCTSRLQVDDEKLNGRRTFRCPKCNQEIYASAASPASEKSALALGNSPATEGRRYEHPSPAPLFEPETGAHKPVFSDTEKLMQALAGLLTQGEKKQVGDSLERAPWDRRKVLVCTPEEHRSRLAGMLTQEGYQVFVASDTKQAVERMRENPLDVVLLEPSFDTADQGAAFVVREVNVLRPAQRRRVFFVLLSPSLRTMDAHAAFLNNVNAVVNLRELDDLVRVLGHALREYNDLYKDFNSAIGVTAI